MGYDIKKMGEKIQKRRKEKYRTDNKKFSYCRTQESLANKIQSSRGKDCVDRRTIASWECGESFPRSEQLVKLCELLECDADYLLGKTEISLKTVDNISKEIGISCKSIEYIKTDKGIQEMIDFILSSIEIKKIVEAINYNSMMQHISEDILSAYNEPLSKKIYKAYEKFNNKTFPLDKTIEKYREYLIAEIPYSDKIQSTEENPEALNKYLKRNLSKDRYRQILLRIREKKTNKEEEKYNIFINDTVECTYEILEYVFSKKIYMDRIMESFLRIIESYIDKTVSERRETYHEYAKLVVEKK